MLSRTADSLYWLSRYVERSDYLARIIDSTQRLATIPKSYGGIGSGKEWENALLSAGMMEAFQDVYDEINEQNVVAFLAYDPRNASSIIKCVEWARTNARGVRIAITAEMWDTINGGWLDVSRAPPTNSSSSDAIRRFLDFAKKLALDYDGSVYRTMLRNDACWFARLGHYMERADNTARLLDVESDALVPEEKMKDESLDYFRWVTVLRSVSALTAYHWVYRESVKPWLVADLLILKADMPRSLLCSYRNLVSFLDEIADAYHRQGPAQRHARAVLTKLESLSMADIFKQGVHEFVENFLEDNNKLGQIVAEQYLLN